MGTGEELDLESGRRGRCSGDDLGLPCGVTAMQDAQPLWSACGAAGDLLTFAQVVSDGLPALGTNLNSIT